MRGAAWYGARRRDFQRGYLGCRPGGGQELDSHRGEKSSGWLWVVSRQGQCAREVIEGHNQLQTVGLPPQWWICWGLQPLTEVSGDPWLPRWWVGAGQG
jgi:hypothetical protein